jgi:NTP pyrophosphatase (non-canonical NTP hydrolase)
MITPAEDNINPLMNPWYPERDVNSLRALGKTLEELGELTSAVARCLIQGVNEVEPISRKPNRLWLEQEIADVQTQLAILVEHFHLDTQAIATRTRKKYDQMQEWRSM